MKVYIIVLILFLSCSNNNQEKESSQGRLNNSYDYEVLYDYQGTKNIDKDKYRELFDKDSIYIFFEEFFDDDRLEIRKNNRVVFDDKIHTEPSSGLAYVHKLGQIKKIRHISLRINEGPWIDAEIRDKTHNLIGVSKEQNTVHVFYYKKVPVYD